MTEDPTYPQVQKGCPKCGRTEMCDDCRRRAGEDPAPASNRPVGQRSNAYWESVLRDEVAAGRMHG